MAGRQNGAGFLQESEGRGRKRNSGARREHHGVPPAAESEIRIARGWESDRGYARAASRADWTGARTAKGRQGAAIPLGRSLRDVHVSRTARSGDIGSPGG